MFYIQNFRGLYAQVIAQLCFWVVSIYGTKTTGALCNENSCNELDGNTQFLPSDTANGLTAFSQNLVTVSNILSFCNHLDAGPKIQSKCILFIALRVNSLQHCCPSQTCSQNVYPTQTSTMSEDPPPYEIFEERMQDVNGESVIIFLKGEEITISGARCIPLSSWQSLTLYILQPCLRYRVQLSTLSDTKSQCTSFQFLT
jgi:hypothetical protein